MPLVIGPVAKEPLNSFRNLKYSLLVLEKMVKLICKLSMLEIFTRLLFIEEDVHLWPSTLSYADIADFAVHSILDDLILSPSQEMQQLLSNKIRLFYRNLLKSKDNSFIILTMALVSSISDKISQDPRLAK